MSVQFNWLLRLSCLSKYGGGLGFRVYGSNITTQIVSANHLLHCPKLVCRGGVMAEERAPGRTLGFERQ